MRWETEETPSLGLGVAGELTGETLHGRGLVGFHTWWDVGNARERSND